MRRELAPKGLLFLGLSLVSASEVFAQVQQEWVARYHGGVEDGQDGAGTIALDASGNVYVAGSTVLRAPWAYATVKYDPDGNQLWAAHYSGPRNRGSVGGIALDSGGNIHVTGYSEGDGTGNDFTTVKYDPDGNELWVARYNGPGNGSDNANAIALDSAGNVYVTGGSEGVGTSSDYATVKYDSDGNELWVARYNGPGNSHDFGSGIALDADGNVYVTGSSMGAGTNWDYATVKYDSDGNELWVARYNGPGNWEDYANAIALDPAGNAYVTGGSAGVRSGYDYATVKYDSDGNELWVARYNGPGNDNDFARAIVLDVEGNVYVTGESQGGSMDYATVRYDSDGNQLWVARYDGPGHDWDAAFAIVLDAVGNVYVSGQSVGAGTYSDYATVKYDSNGHQLWVVRYDGPIHGPDAARALALDSTGNVYVTGGSCNGAFDPEFGFCQGASDFATVKYAQQ